MDKIKEQIQKISKNRLGIVGALMVLFSLILAARLFVLQIVKGDAYQENYTLKIAKTEKIPATRGNIYDRNGNVLAYNELAYAVTIHDTGEYKDKKEKNEKLNEEICTIIRRLRKNGDGIDNDFKIKINESGEYEFTVSGSALQRFRADMYDKTYVTDLGYDSKLEYDTSTATADQVMDYLIHDRYGISDDYDKKTQYEIAIIRYGMSLNAYQKYIGTVISSDVSQKSVAFIEENKNELTGVSIEESTVRRYVDGEYFSNILGYTGTISSEQYEERKLTDENVEKTDVVGKAGLEEYLDPYLSGNKGERMLYVDSVGKLLEIMKQDYPDSGQNAYLSIDKDLQISTYRLLEQEIAGIIYSKIVNEKEYTASSRSGASDIVIPVYDVYFALLNNGLIDTYELSNNDASDISKNVYAAFSAHQERALSDIESYLLSDSPRPYNSLSEEYQEMMTFIVKDLKEQGILDTEKIDAKDEMQQKWTSEELSVKEYLLYAIENEWLNIAYFTEVNKYLDTQEVYEELVSYTINRLEKLKAYNLLVYKYAIANDEISGNELCAILYDQNVLPSDEETRSSLLNGSLSAYQFIKDKINNLEITPGQLALDPCSGSCVIIDVTTGETLALVSYPGYDNNKLANPTSSSYYSYLNSSLSNPLYNHATQQRTAPGSTFKIVSATAGLSEGVIDTDTEIEDLGIFEEVSNKPKCWYWPSSHGFINVSQAIRDSCNYFFYTVGYDLAGGERYSDSAGIEKITRYATLYGLADKTGIEIDEAEPKIATEYPVMAAIGQSDNNYTTVCLARYAAAVANSGTVYNLTLLDHIEDSEGNIVESFSPSVKNKVDVLDSSEWNAIHSGMRMVCEEMDSFDNFPVNIAGKTGTAQETKTRPNHALFIGYAPYENPKIAVCTRIPNGYTSHNSADVSKHIIGAYFGVEESKQLSKGNSATAISSSSSQNTITD